MYQKEANSVFITGSNISSCCLWNAGQQGHLRGLMRTGLCGQWDDPLVGIRSTANRQQMSQEESQGFRRAEVRGCGSGRKSMTSGRLSLPWSEMFSSWCDVSSSSLCSLESHTNALASNTVRVWEDIWCVGYGLNTPLCAGLSSLGSRLQPLPSNFVRT